MKRIVLSLQRLGTPVVVVFCLLVTAAVQLQQLNKLKYQNTDSANLKHELAPEKLRLELLRQTPTFGFKNIVADWAFLNFLQYFGDEPARRVTGYILSPDYFEIIVERDPKFLNIYPFLSTSVSLYAARPEQSVSLMEKGLKSLAPNAPPQSYYVWRYKGIDELLFLGDSQAAQHSFATAAEWASTNSNPESKNIAAISRQTAQFLARNPESESAQISAWMMVLSNAVDDRARQLAAKRIQALGGKITITPQGEVKVQLPKAD